MGKASEHRKKQRSIYLGRLARENPGKFMTEWAKRLESWSREIDRQADLLEDEDGKVGSVFDQIEAALGELARCGRAAVELAREATEEVMMGSCCTAVAAVVDRRLYELSKAAKFELRMLAS